MACLDLTTGASFSYEPRLRVAAASLVKVDILVALLLTRPRLTTDLASQAALMIRRSDNAAATTLWSEVGGSPGLSGVYQRLGLRDTAPDPTQAWGATRTSATDRLRLLSVLATASSPLSSGLRMYVLDLMSNVQPDQAWGISAAAQPGDTVALKNGWLPRDVDGGTWTVNSMGRITGSGRDLLLAVLSQGHPTLQQGIAAVEQTARLIPRQL